MMDSTRCSTYVRPSIDRVRRTTYRSSTDRPSSTPCTQTASHMGPYRRRRELGASVMEYALLTGLLVIACIVSIRAVGHMPGQAVCGYVTGGPVDSAQYQNGACYLDPFDPSAGTAW